MRMIEILSVRRRPKELIVDFQCCQIHEVWGLRFFNIREYYWDHYGPKERSSIRPSRKALDKALAFFIHGHGIPDLGDLHRVLYQSKEPLRPQRLTLWDHLDEVTLPVIKSLK